MPQVKRSAAAGGCENKKRKRQDGNPPPTRASEPSLPANQGAYRTGRLPECATRVMRSLFEMNKQLCPKFTQFFGGAVYLVETQNLMTTLVTQVSAAAGIPALVAHPNPDCVGKDGVWLLHASGHCAARIDSDAPMAYTVMVCIDTEKPYTMRLLLPNKDGSNETADVAITTATYLIFPNTVRVCRQRLAEIDAARVTLTVLCAQGSISA